MAQGSADGLASHGRFESTKEPIEEPASAIRVWTGDSDVCVHVGPMGSGEEFADLLKAL